MGQSSKRSTQGACKQGRMFPHITVSPEIMADFCRRWHVSEMSLFGSVLCDDYTHESDIDVLVAFEPGNVPGLQFCCMASELSCLLGRPVDIVTRSAVERSPNHIRRKAILESAEVIYVAG